MQLQHANVFNEAAAQQFPCHLCFLLAKSSPPPFFFFFLIPPEICAEEKHSWHSWLSQGMWAGHCHSFQNKEKMQLQAILKRHLDQSSPGVTGTSQAQPAALDVKEDSQNLSSPAVGNSVDKQTHWLKRPSCANVGSCFSPSYKASRACFAMPVSCCTCHCALKLGTFGGQSETKAAISVRLFHSPHVLLSKAWST